MAMEQTTTTIIKLMKILGVPCVASMVHVPLLVRYNAHKGKIGRLYNSLVRHLRRQSAFETNSDGKTSTDKARGGTTRWLAVTISPSIWYLSHSCFVHIGSAGNRTFVPYHSLSYSSKIYRCSVCTMVYTDCPFTHPVNRAKMVDIIIHHLNWVRLSFA